MLTVLVHLDDGRVGGARAAVETAFVPERTAVVPGGGGGRAKVKLPRTVSARARRARKKLLRANKTAATSVKREGKYLNMGRLTLSLS